MITEIGHFALILALAVAVVQAIVPLIGASRGDVAWMRVGGTAATAQFLLIFIAFLALMHAQVTLDFSVLNVVQNSHTDKPMLYRITGVWGSHEGSLLLWVTILSLFGMAVAVFGRNLPPGLKARTLSVQAMVGVGFLTFCLLASNPFLRVNPAPINGDGLNPLLQDPGLAFHPPFLYLGYVGLSVAFSFAVAALIEGKVDAAWARWVRPWTLAAWTFLTIGIAGGAWWAYYTLGWGGWWFWDPTENASFMPWLIATALLHSAIVVEKRDSMKGWTVLLAIIAFGFSLLGTFVVRSGVLTSVHSFAVDPKRGVYILGLLVAYLGGAFALYGIRAPSLRLGNGLFSPISREGGLLLNNVLMATGAATVMLGTLYPLIVQAVGGGKISVGPPFFDSVFVPLMMPMLLVLGVGPLLSWKRADLGAALGRVKLAAVIAIATVIITWFAQGGSLRLWWAAGGMGLAAWLAIASFLELAERLRLFRAPLAESWRRAIRLPRSAWGMSLAHGGLALVVAAMFGSTAWQSQSVQNQKIGQTVTVGGYGFTLKGIRNVKGPNYSAQQATFVVTQDGRQVAVLHPQQRHFVMPPVPTTDAAIQGTVFGDVYAVLGGPAGPDSWVTRIYFNPLMPWMWVGAGMLALGGFASLSDRRHRVGAPKRARTAGAAAHPAGA